MGVGLKRSIGVLAAYLVPIVVLELAVQAIAGVGPLGPLGFGTQPEMVGLQVPSRCVAAHPGRLYADRPNASVEFCADSWGTIEPTSVSGARAARRQRPSTPVLLVCGGSTSEANLVSPPDRWPASAARIAGLPVVNASRSGKTLLGCVDTIDFALTHLPGGQDTTIAIVTSLNTLGTFMGARAALDAGGLWVPPLDWSLGRPEPIRRWLPGMVHLVSLVGHALAPPPTGTTYADALAAGCCHMAAEANRDAQKRFDWDDPRNLAFYRTFVEVRLDRLDGILSRHGVARQRVAVVQEPNAYGAGPSMPHTASDFRQRLRGIDGAVLDLERAAAILAIYDDIYLEAARGRGYRVLPSAGLDLPASAFYDAAHMTAPGARLHGEKLAARLAEAGLFPPR